MRIQRGFEEQDRNNAAEMFWGAFKGKLGFCLGPETKALAFIATAMQPRQSFAAYDSDKLLGLVGIKTAVGGLIGGDLNDLAQVYGYLGAAWRGPALTLFGRKIASDQLLLDGIFVGSGSRGKGVGTALLEAVEHFAMVEFYRDIRLDVIDTNPRARKLYEERGFIAGTYTKTGILKPILGFDAATTMIKRL